MSWSINQSEGELEDVTLTTPATAELRKLPMPRAASCREASWSLRTAWKQRVIVWHGALAEFRISAYPVSYGRDVGTVVLAQDLWDRWVPAGTVDGGMKRVFKGPVLDRNIKNRQAKTRRSVIYNNATENTPDRWRETCVMGTRGNDWPSWILSGHCICP
jgi:hypothetical protein